MLQTHVTADIDLSDTIEMLNDGDRLEWMTALLETIKDEGTIDAARALVNDPRWNDQDPKQP